MHFIIQYLRDHAETVVRSKWFQCGYELAVLGKFAWHRIAGSVPHAACAATLRCERLARSVDGWHLSRLINQVNCDLFQLLRRAVDENPLLNSYVLSSEAKRLREEFKGYGIQHQLRLRYPRADDVPTRQGDLLILKPHIGPREKGVLFIQYSDAFLKFVSIFDAKEISRCYRIVLEPSTWGYCDPSILFFAGLQTDVIVEAQYAGDYEFIESFGGNLVPVRLGAGDWVDPDRFVAGPANERGYDVVMVASWQRIKQHELLFSALSKCGSAIGKVALIGYATDGRVRADVLREAEAFGVAEKLEVFESVSRERVGEIVRRSKVGVMLTIREGANKGIYECLFSGVPVIVTDRNIGVNRDHINHRTGVLASDSGLAATLMKLVENSVSYSPREWAVENTGYLNSTKRLNDLLKKCALERGEDWSRDIFTKKNDTNAQYVFEEERIEADKAIPSLEKFLRPC